MLSYFDKRPAMTYKYGVFDQRTWTAHIGMGNETQGSAIAGEHFQSAVSAAPMFPALHLSFGLFGGWSFCVTQPGAGLESPGYAASGNLLPRSR